MRLDNSRALPVATALLAEPWCTGSVILLSPRRVAARAAAEQGHRVEIVEALPQIGGQFRLAGMQPRRAQILDLMEWYERQFTKLGVSLRLNTFLDEAEIAAHPKLRGLVMGTNDLAKELGSPGDGLNGTSYPEGVGGLHRKHIGRVCEDE